MSPGQPKRTSQNHGRPKAHLETELLLDCARTSLSSSTAERVRELALQPLDWALLYQMALAHRVGPLLHRNLQRSAPQSVPAPFVAHLRDHARATGRRNLFLTGRLLHLLAAFNDRRIRVIPFKGPLIATHVYGDLVVRPFSDLDVLIHARDVAAAKAMLSAHGYEQRTSHPWEAPFEDPTGVEVDLHWGIGPSYDPTPRTFDQLWARAVSLPLEGVEVRSLAPEDLLLVLSIQIAKDWRGSGQRLLQICDTAELLRRYPGLDWTQVLRLARASGGERILQLDLLLSHELLSAPVPEPVLRSAQASRAARTLALELRAQMFPLPATSETSPEGLAPWREKSTLSLRTRERWRDKLRYFILRGWQRIHLAIRPSRSDREFIRLPTRLEFLYYVVRPLRVASRRARADGMPSKADSADTSPY